MVVLTEELVLARSRASDLESVRKLNCWGGDISDVSILRKLPNVQVVSLSVNNITSLEDFAFCPNLEEIYIRKNKVMDLREVCFLQSLPKLTKLWLSDNPCDTSPKYRLSVIKALPNLQKLDNIVITEEEKNEAADNGEELLPLPAREKPVQEDGQEQTENCTDGIIVKSLDCLPSGDGLTSPLPRDHKIRHSSPLLLSLGETNEIRKELGLKPLTLEKMVQGKRKKRFSVGDSGRNSNILQSVLLLIKELDEEALEVVAESIRSRLEQI